MELAKRYAKIELQVLCTIVTISYAMFHKSYSDNKIGNTFYQDFK